MATFTPAPGYHVENVNINGVDYGPIPTWDFANIAEAQYAQSRPDFISKYNIALKEANETRNWINLLHDTGYIDQAAYDSIYDDINQIVIILISILRKLKGNSDNKNNG